MKFSCKAEPLRKAINRVAQAIEPKAQLEIFRSIRMDIGNNAISFTGSMPGLYVEEVVASEGTLPVAAVSCPGKKLQAIIDTLPGEDCTFTVGEEDIVISSKRTRHKLQLSSVRDSFSYAWPEGGFQEFDVQALASALRKVTKNLKEKPNQQPYCSVVNITPENIATLDGVALNRALNNTGIVPASSFNLSVDHAESIYKVLSEFSGVGWYAFNDGDFCISVGSLRISSVGVSIIYPDYLSIIGRHSVLQFSIQRNDFRDELKRVLSGADPSDDKGVLLEVGQSGIKISGNFKTGTAETFLHMTIETETGMSLYCDLELLLRALDSLSPTIEVGIATPQNPIRLRGIGHECYVMPRRF
jgi:DNA polymerase III sliding clamp (beta) subunit (PCNA family)